MFRLQELYHEMHALDRFEQDYRRKAQEEDNSNTTQKSNYFFVYLNWRYFCYIIVHFI